MPYSIQILLAATIIVGFLLAVDYHCWRNRIHYRRCCRKAHVNLNRAVGR